MELKETFDTMPSYLRDNILAFGKGIIIGMYFGTLHSYSQYKNKHNAPICSTMENIGVSTVAEWLLNGVGKINGIEDVSKDDIGSISGMAVGYEASELICKVLKKTSGGVKNVEKSFTD